MRQATSRLVGLMLSGLLWVVGAAGDCEGQLIGYWPLDSDAGLVTPNAVAGGTDAILFGDAFVVSDATRGNVLSLGGTAGTYADAGILPNIDPNTDFTWSFWAQQTQIDPPDEPNDVILGNRQPDTGWIKFTPTNFEYRDVNGLGGDFINTIDTPDLTQAAGWTHNAVVKRGSEMYYYQNGLLRGASTATGSLIAIPFFFGGDAVAGENWGGMLDDVAIWSSALPTSSVIGLANGAYDPSSAPLTESPGDPPQVVMQDDFNDTVLSSQWQITNRGLENNGPTTYDLPNTTTFPGELTLGGPTDAQYWYGNSVESVIDFDSSAPTVITVDRTSLTGNGTAYRSSLWVVGDDGHYLHFSQNVGETGWSFNARDDNGVGTRNETGGGFNLAQADALDTDPGFHEMKIVLEPTGVDGEVGMSMFLDGMLVGANGFSSFPNRFKVVLTGQARAIGDDVSASFDNLIISQVVSAQPLTGDYNGNG
ncbi:MAG: LamG domain-containing protein, partial [Planctomycetales bacterium]|nr:LamG domain-containing protein [Planctomycetales bacterium]